MDETCIAIVAISAAAVSSLAWYLVPFSPALPPADTTDELTTNLSTFAWLGAAIPGGILGLAIVVPEGSRTLQSVSLLLSLIGLGSLPWSSLFAIAFIARRRWWSALKLSLLSASLAVVVAANLYILFRAI